MWSVAWTRWNQIFTGSVDETARVWSVAVASSKGPHAFVFIALMVVLDVLGTGLYRSADLEQLHVLGGQRLGVISVAASPNEQGGLDGREVV